MGRLVPRSTAYCTHSLALDYTQESCCCSDYYWPKYPLGSFPSASMAAGLHRLITEAKQ